MAKISNIENESIDLMDAYLQLLLAVTWQQERSDGIERLLELAQLVRQKVNECGNIFDSDHERTLAASQIFDSLQDARQQPGAMRHLHTLVDWASTPLDLNLPRLHRDTDSPYLIAMALVAEVKKDVEARIPRSEITAQVCKTIHAYGKKNNFPFYVPTLAACIVDLASRPWHSSQEEVRTEVARYERAAESWATNKKLIIRSQIVAELHPLTDAIHLEIDQSYSWSNLAMSFEGKTSLMALSFYTQLNFYGLVNDAHFSHRAVTTTIIPPAEFHRMINTSFIRGSTLLFSGIDRETRIMRRRIFDAERADVRIDGKRVNDSLVLLVPNEDDSFDIERQLALLLMQLDSVWRRRNINSENSTEFFHGLPESLRDLVAYHGIRRKIINTKKTLLFCLAGLIAENVYQNRNRYKILLKNGKRVKTKNDVDEYVISLLKNHGFQYSFETLRKGRTRWRHEFLDRVPYFFGFNETEAKSESTTP